MEWIYKGVKYYTIPHNNTIPNNKNLIIGPDKRYLIYQTKWDKCYWLCILGIHGSGARYKAFLEDVYEKDKCFWCDAKWVEFIAKK